MTQNSFTFVSANAALRQHRFEEAVHRYRQAREVVPEELLEHIDFNLFHLSRLSRGDEKNPVLVTTPDSLPAASRLTGWDVLVFVLARSLASGSQTAQLLSRRAGYPVGVVVLLTGEDDFQPDSGLSGFLRSLSAKYALFTREGTMPCREWLRHAYSSVKTAGAEAVRANTGMNTPRLPWRDVLAAPAVLGRLADGADVAEGQHTFASDFLLAHVSDTAGEAPLDKGRPGEVHQCEMADLRSPGMQFEREVCVVMPCLNPERGLDTARRLLDRAGTEADFVVAVDSERQGFIPTLNQVAQRSAAKYIVYLAEDAWPGDRWLHQAYEQLRQNDAKLLGFNCGKWHGRVAAFGLVDKTWAYSLYGDQVLYQGYTSHRADNELTAIARAQGAYVYAPDCVLVENDVAKVFRTSERQAGNFTRADATLFRERFHTRFGGLVPADSLDALHDEYLDLPKYYDSLPKLTID